MTAGPTAAPVPMTVSPTIAPVPTPVDTIVSDTEDCFFYGVDYWATAEDPVVVAATPEACQLACQQSDHCNHWTHLTVDDIHGRAQDNQCYLIAEDPPRIAQENAAGAVSGPKYC